MTMKTDYKTIRTELRDGLAILTVDNPPVNQMSPQMARDFQSAVTEAFEDDAVKAVILTGAGKNFIAGADITQLQKECHGCDHTDSLASCQILVIFYFEPSTSEKSHLSKDLGIKR